jgi:hypothetical protein
MSDAATLAGLARKYATLVELRRRRDAGGDAAGGGALRALATEFPGCLRELDTLGLAELERRAHATTAAVAGLPREPWMDWIVAYHALLRGGLALRDPARAPPRRDQTDMAALVAIAGAAAGAGGAALIDASFVADVLAPPGGRVGVVVLRALAAHFDVPATTISATLFPARRPSPYAL